jgi:hypothetical protein
MLFCCRYLYEGKRCGAISYTCASHNKTTVGETRIVEVKT